MGIRYHEHQKVNIGSCDDGYITQLQLILEAFKVVIAEVEAAKAKALAEEEERARLLAEAEAAETGGFDDDNYDGGLF